MEKNIGKYELLYIVHPDLEASIDKITDRIHALINSRNGKVTYEENWGKRKLAYPIKKTDVGIYLLWFFEAPKESLAKIERDLRLTEEIIRYILLSTTDKKVKPAARKVKKDKEAEKVEEEIKEPEKKTVKIIKKTAVKAAPKKTVAPKKKKEAVPEESEEDRMKMLDEKLGAILGDESDNKEVKGKETK